MQETERFEDSSSGSVAGSDMRIENPAEETPVNGSSKAPSGRSRCGRKRFGFYAGEQAVIQRMMELRAEGKGFDKIAEQLNSEAIPSRSGKVWHGRVINRILKAEGPSEAERPASMTGSAGGA